MNEVASNDRSGMHTRPRVAHLVSPYLFPTGSWIHAQLDHNPRYRAVVMTQRTENLGTFPFDPIHDLSRATHSRDPLAISKYLFGRFPARPYVDAAHASGVVLLHAHQGWEGARTVHLKRKLGLPFITSFYGRDATVMPRKLYWRILYRRLFEEGDIFVAEGKFMGRTLERIGCPPEKIRVVHLGVDLSRIPFAERVPGPGGEVVGLIAASFREKKGIPYALEAVARASRRFPGLKLKVIGDGPMRAEIEMRAREPDLAGRVDLLGFRPFPEYLVELQRAHFLLAPSVTARDGDGEGGAPICILEAQGAGMPVIATMHCDIPEATLPGTSALLSPERDVDALTANLERLLDRPEQWGAMGRAGRTHVETQFDIMKQGARMGDLYDEALAALPRAS